MTPVGGSHGEMDETPRLSDADLERLLAGKAPLGGDEAPELRQFFQDVRSRYTTEAPASVQQEHLARIVAAARAHSPQTKSPWQPAAALTSGGSGDGRPPWRRKIVLSSIFGSITTKILLGVVAAAAATGGLAAAGALPTPVQNAVASAAGGVGVNLPNPQETTAAAEAQGQKVVTAVTDLVNHVSDTDQQTASLTSDAIESSTTCTQNVSSTASALSGLSATTFADAQSLAARATALAQESVGCGLDKDADSVTATAHESVTGTVHSDITAAGAAIASAVQSCAGPLKSAIQTLVSAALSGKSTTDIANLTTDAKAVATAAETCATDIATALNGLHLTPIRVPTSLPTGAPKLTLPFTFPTIRPSALPTALPTGLPGNLSSLADPSQWLKLLSQIPGVPTAPVNGSANSSTGFGSWTGMTGSWTGTTWNPYTGSSSDGSHSGDSISGSSSGSRHH